jgi:hypothetical protein
VWQGRGFEVGGWRGIGDWKEVNLVWEGKQRSGMGMGRGGGKHGGNFLLFGKKAIVGTIY